MQEVPDRWGQGNETETKRSVCVCVSFVDTDGDEMATLYDKFDKEIKRIGWKCLAT